MSSESYEGEVNALKELGLTHTGLIYSLGIARAATNLKLAVLLRVLKDLPPGTTDDQLTQLGAVLSRGKVGEAKALIASFKRGSSEGVSLRVSTQHGMLQEFIAKHTAFTEVFEVNGRLFARNPHTGEVLSADQANLLLKQSQEAIAKVEAEKPGGTEDVLASRLQATMVVEYSNLLGPDNTELICDKCALPIPEDDLLPLDACGHLLHTACILQHIMTQVQAMIFPVTCPLSNCRLEISALDLQERLSADDLALYEQNSFRHFVQEHTGDLQSCPSPDCSYVFSWIGDGSEFECPLCCRSYCLTCKTDWHTDLTCQQFKLRSDPAQVELAFESLERNKHCKQCSHCHFWVEKSDHSNILDCRCGRKFCFKCGEEAAEACRCRRRRDQGNFMSSVSSFFKKMTGH
jgi:hypothetical protein